MIAANLAPIGRTPLKVSVGGASMSRLTLILAIARTCVRRRPQTLPLESLESRRLLSFSAPVSYNIGTQSDTFVPNAAPINVVTADFNGDGKLDLIVSHKAENSVYFLAGNGDGTFQPAVQIPV